MAAGVMNILDALTPDCVKVPLAATERKQSIQELVDLLHQAGRVKDPAPLMQAVWEREQQRSTGIGEGLAIPHGKTPALSDLVIAVGRPAQPIGFDAIDKKPVQLVILLASPPDRTSEHIQALGRISRLMSDPELRKAAYEAQTSEQLYELFHSADA